MINIRKDKYRVIGVMSGTSLDGVDIACCDFFSDNTGWSYEIGAAKTVAYSSFWKNTLLNLEEVDAFAFQQTHVDYGFLLGTMVLDFINANDIKADFISSHGHTIFHQPEKKLSVQIGGGFAIAARTGLPVVCDFRSLDVALGGQGAPLVPVGDKWLFSEYDFCLNLGGFANVSFEFNNKRIAFDICPVNIVMNTICEKLGKEFDNNGDIARSGSINENLLNELNQLAFFHQPFNTPKSLGKEWVLKNIYPLLEKFDLAPASILRTFCEHIAIQISRTLKDKAPGKLLVTGGGAYNTFLMECIKQQTAHQLVLPDKNTIEFKEALIFAFIGVLRVRGEVNCFSSVTGAQKDSSSGAVYFPGDPSPSPQK